MRRDRSPPPLARRSGGKFRPVLAEERQPRAKRAFGSLCRCVAVAVLAGMVAWTAWRTLRANSICRARATVVSIEAALVALVQAGPAVGSLSLPARSTAPATTLAPPETDRLLEQLARVYTLDYPRGWVGTGPMLDPWGERFILYWAPSPGQETDQLHAGSSGPDRLWGTADDILGNRGDNPRRPELTRGV